MYGVLGKISKNRFLLQFESNICVLVRYWNLIGEESNSDDVFNGFTNSEERFTNIMRAMVARTLLNPVVESHEPK